MDDKKLEELNAKVEKFRAKMQAYVRIGFGLVILFALLGNCTGHHEGAGTIFVIVVTIWVMTRIITEALNAYDTLRKDHNKARELRTTKEPKKKWDGDDDDPPMPPPMPPM